MKYALIGCGRISTNHVKAVVNNKLEFVAACDVVPEHIENVLAKHGLENDTSIKRPPSSRLPELFSEIHKRHQNQAFSNL